MNGHKTRHTGFSLALSRRPPDISVPSPWREHFSGGAINHAAGRDQGPGQRGRRTCGADGEAGDRRSSTQAVPVGYGLYGMRDLPYMDGLGHLARIGYKHVELTLRPGWNPSPSCRRVRTARRSGNGSAIWGSRSSMSWRGCSRPRTSRSSRISSGSEPPRRWRTSARPAHPP